MNYTPEAFTRYLYDDIDWDNRLTFEIGERSKTQRQIQNTAQSYIAADDMESGSGRKIPLWIFGFLY